VCAVSVMRTCGCLWCAREGARARGRGWWLMLLRAATRRGAARARAAFMKLSRSIMAANVFARVFHVRAAAEWGDVP